jgi:hypothetical protein
MSREQAFLKPQQSGFFAQFAVYGKRCYRRTTYFRESFDGLLVICPAKMLLPDLRAWVEKDDFFSRNRVNALNLIRLCQIAGCARESAIWLGILSAESAWD